MKYQNALITGGAGFIGGHLAHRLVEEGKSVRVLDNLSVGDKKNIPDSAELIIGDIRDTEIVIKALKKVDIVFHLAAKVSIRLAVHEFHDDADVNLMGTLNMLRCSRDSGVRKFIYASSMAVYGNPDYSPQDENHPQRPTSPYGVSKLSSEKYISLLAPLWGMDYLNLRLFNTYGPRQTLSPYVGVITIFIRKLLANEKIQIFGDGKQRRDFIYVGDVAEAFKLAADSNASGLSMNIGTGIPTDVNRIADMLIEKLGADIKPEHTPPVPGEPGDSIADANLAFKNTGFSFRYKLSEKIEEVIDWNRQKSTGK
jgi:UDP-glucose 4-epimerase